MNIKAWGLLEVYCQEFEKAEHERILKEKGYAWNCRRESNRLVYSIYAVADVMAGTVKPQ